MSLFKEYCEWLHLFKKKKIIKYYILCLGRRAQFHNNTQFDQFLSSIHFCTNYLFLFCFCFWLFFSRVKKVLTIVYKCLTSIYKATYERIAFIIIIIITTRGLKSFTHVRKDSCQIYRYR